MSAPTFCKSIASILSSWNASEGLAAYNRVEMLGQHDDSVEL